MQIQNIYNSTEDVATDEISSAIAEVFAEVCYRNGSTCKFWHVVEQRPHSYKSYKGITRV